MSVIELIQELQDQDIRLWLDEGQLRFSAPKGGMNDALRDQLREHKNAIIAFLAHAQKSQQSPIESVDHTGLQVLSFAQERIWFLSQLTPDNTAFHLQHLFEIKGPLDKQRLEKAITALAERNSILRTAYISNASGTWQKIMPSNAITLRHIKADSATFGDAVLDNIVLKESRTAFQLEHGDVFRHLLIELNHEHHILLTTVHHIATDGWSMNLLAGEITALYQSFADEKPALTSNALHYQDFAVWQRAQLHSATMQEQLDYWRQTLAGTPALQLPSDSPSIASCEAQGASLPFTLDKTTTSALHQLANDNNATLYMVLLALFSVLLNRFSQQQDFCIGTPVAGRNHPQLENVSGCFLNMLAIRCKPQAQNFTDYLAEIRQQVLEAFEHQDLPFEHVVREVVKTRDLAVSPLFQVMFSLHNADHIHALPVDGLSIRSLKINKHAALYDLSLNASEWEGEINGEFIWRRNLLSADLVNSMEESFKQLINSVIADPAGAIDVAAWVNANDIALQDSWNNNQQLRQEYPLLHHYIEKAAEQYPHNTAIHFNGETLSYRALNYQANQLARFLRQQNTAPFVGVYLERSLNLPVALLAIIKAGFAYLPLDTSYPAARLAHMINDAQLSHIIVDTHSITDALPKHIQLLHLEEDADNINTFDGNNIEKTAETNVLFNVIYTSGSTGAPKGVVVSHQAMINRLLWMQEQFPIDSSDKVLQKTPYSFDVSVWEIFWPLMCGAELVMAHMQEHRNPLYLTQIIAQYKITTLHFVPSMLGVFLQYANLENCASLKRMFCSGEVLNANLAQHCLSTLPNCELYNLYGPTEAAIDVSWHKVGMNDSSIPIGKAIANTELYITNHKQQRLPIGAIGEILIAGRNLAEGYLGKPDLTAQAFIEIPALPNKRLYRTGDLGRFDRNGNLYFIGRQDQQIKIRGFRVELSEIEHCLLKHPDIQEALVIAHNAHLHDDRLIAYFISPNNTLNNDDLRSFVQQHLPSYMLPNHFIQLNEWPLTSHGKINRQLLPGIDQSQSSHELRVAPRDEIEEAIAQIWSELLDIQEIGVFDDFFSLGGHSLLASLAVTRMQERFGINIPLADIFTDPSINTIAAAVRKALLQKDLLIKGQADEGEEDILL